MGGLEVTGEVTLSVAEYAEGVKRHAVDSERKRLALVLLEGAESDLRLNAAPSWANGRHTAKGRAKVKPLTSTQRARLAAMVLLGPDS